MDPQSQAELALAEQAAMAFQQWRALPQTQALWALFQRRLRETERRFSNKDFVGDTLDSTALKHVQAIGGCEVLKQLINLDAVDLEEPEDEEL